MRVQRTRGSCIGCARWQQNLGVYVITRVRQRRRLQTQRSTGRVEGLATASTPPTFVGAALSHGGQPQQAAAAHKAGWSQPGYLCPRVHT